jgi:TorA maturation chaperone TorD
MASIDAPMRQAGQRAQGYWLLSRLFLEVPTATKLADLRRTLGDSAPGASSAELSALRDAVDAAIAEADAAAIAYTRHLCLGNPRSGEPLPFEAHVREGCLPGDSTQEVAAAMREAGFEDVAPAASSPDHLGSELRFMALLCHQEYEAWARGDRRGAGMALHRQQEFLSSHLSQWAPDYCRGLAKRASNDYLCAVAALGAISIDEDLELLKDICRWLVPEDLVSLGSVAAAAREGTPADATPEGV